MQIITLSQVDYSRTSLIAYRRETDFICNKWGYAISEVYHTAKMWKRVRSVQCVASVKRLELTHCTRHTRFTLQCQCTWNRPMKIDADKSNKFGQQISVCNKWGCMHPLNLIIFRRARGRGTDFVCNKWGYAISEVCNKWGFSLQSNPS